MSDIETKITWREYEVGDGIGCWLRSPEVVPLGTVRFLAGKLMYAYLTYPRTNWWFGQTTGTWWTPTENNSYEEMRKWKATLL